MLRNIVTIRSLVFAAILIFYTGCGESPPFDLESVSRKTKPPLTVDAIAIEKVESIIETVTYFGQLQPNRQAVLGFGVAGNIDSIPAIGERFAKGDSMASLVEAADLEVQKAGIEQNMETARTNGQSVEQLQIQLRNIETALSGSRIKAPFDCVIAEVMTFESGLIESRKPAIRIFELSRPNIEIGLPRRVAQWINDQQSYNFVIEGSARQAKYLRRSVKENPVGSLTLWFELTDVQGLNATFGSTVECRFNLRSDLSGYWVPLASLRRSGEGVWSVFSVAPSTQTQSATGTVEQRLVTIKKFDGSRVLIDGNLNLNTLVIAAGGHRVVSGQTVSINSIDPASSVARKTGVDP